MKSPGDLYVGILKSRSIGAQLVKRFYLKSVYKLEKESQAEKRLASNSTFEVGTKDSIVTISVIDKSATRAQALTNAYLDAQREANGRLALSESSQRRLFFGQQLAKEKGPDVLRFVTAQRRPRKGAENVVRISDGESGLSASTIKRRLAAVSSLYGYLVIRGDAGVVTNPVPRGLPTRRNRHRGERGAPLVRGVRRLPRILNPDEVEALMAALRTERDRAMAQAMLLGGLRRGEVLGLRLEDLRLGEWRVFIAEGKGGHQRLVPISPTFFATVADYMNKERPPDAPTDRLFVSLKGPRRGQPLSTEGIIEIFSAARGRAGLAHGTCHELRHTCFTRLREGGMAIEAVQAQAGHRSIASTRIYLHLSIDWLAEEYRKAMEALPHRWRWPDERPPEGSTKSLRRGGSRSSSPGPRRPAGHR